MSQPWKLLPLAAIFVAIGALIVAPGGATQPGPAAAYLCGNNETGTIRIQILDDVTSNPITVAGSSVTISPNPATGSGSSIVVDNTGDGDNDPGIIEIADACSTEGTEDYEVQLIALPNALSDCTFLDDFDIDDLDPDATANFILYVDCTALATPTATPTTTVTVTPTVGPAAKITVSASPQTVSCSGTSIITIQVRDDNDDPVPPGTAINVTSTLGSISPSAGTTADDSGDGFLFFTADADKGGLAVITAKSGDAEGSTNVTVNCGAAPTATTAPQPTAAPGGVISPPNTGSAGLADTEGSGWFAFAAAAFASTISLALIATARARA